MARIARVVGPGIPHHITQRGNRRQETFFGAEDYQAYIELMREWCGYWKVEVWAYCLMPNHVHLIAVPPSEEGLRRAIGEAHRRYTRRVNFREGWRGHLWQGRFASFPLDERYLLAAARYIEQNPVAAGLVPNPESWTFSSCGAGFQPASIEFTNPRNTPFTEPRNRGELPHLHKEGGTYFITWRLLDALLSYHSSGK